MEKKYEVKSFCIKTYMFLYEDFFVLECFWIFYINFKHLILHTSPSSPFLPFSPLLSYPT